MFNKDQKEQHLHGAGDAYLLSQKVAELFQKEYCVLLNSATSAIETICEVLGIKGKLIYTSNYNWPGALSPFIRNNNKIIVGKANRNFSIDLDDLKHYSPDIVLAVDFHGIAHSDQKEVADYCKSTNALLITDASCSMGTNNSDGFSTGYYSDLVVTSFGPQKPFFAGEGGAILTNSLSVFESCILNTEHPYRHIAEGLERNYFSVNKRMNPFGISYLNQHFEEEKIFLYERQKKGYSLYLNISDSVIKSTDAPNYTQNNATYYFLIADTMKSCYWLEPNRIQSLRSYILPNNLKKKGRLIFTEESIKDCCRECCIIELI